MFTESKDRTQDTLLREEILCGEASFRTLAEAIAAGIFISRGKRLHYVNPAAQTITGYSRDELLLMNFWDLVHPDYWELVPKEARVREGDIVVRGQHEIKILAKNGQERWLDIRTGPVELDGAMSTLVSAFDLTERKHAEDKAQLLAVTDPLTGLGNYRRLVASLDAEIKRTRRTGRSFAVLLLDLNRLKKINDRYGHLIGSQALCRLSDVLRVSCRAIDTAARYGGDEFAVILPETNLIAATLVASRIRSRLGADRLEPALSVSTGVAVYPRDGETLQDLLRQADRELYEMKCRCAEQRSLLVAV